jgi:hypothetical protein
MEVSQHTRIILALSRLFKKQHGWKILKQVAHGSQHACRL